jgi:signal transduction histidine kinase
VSKQPSAPGMVSTRFARPMGFVRDLPIWTKLGLIMIVPTIATIVVGTAGLLDQVDKASGAERARSLTVLSGDAGALVHGLQDERAIAVQLLTAPQPSVAPLKDVYAKQQTKTDASYTKYRTSRATIADVPDNLLGLLGDIEAQLGELPVMRGQVNDLNKMPLTVAEDRYQVLISDLLQIRDLSAQLTGDSTLTDRMRAAASVATAKEFISQERSIILIALAADDLSSADHDEYIGAVTGKNLALNTFEAVATPEQREFYARTVTGPQIREATEYEGLMESLRPDESPLSKVSMANWDKAMVGRAELMNQVEIALNQQAQAAASDLGERVQRRVLVETGLLLMTLLLGVLFAWLVARSMARSLRDLRQGALAVAQYGLPQAVARLRDPSLASHLSPAGVALQIAEPLPVRSNDEFGQVTEAFNAVHLEAVRTAAEQAALRSSVATMFVNLARRSQILVDRLIGHLDRLERGEQDPDRLSELFQLDHLATRMRRNDENLLVLAGADSTRIQREPAALMDVLRAAQSEVEHYTRIEFTIIDQDIEIAAHAVNDLVHLVAELFDNATAFSPPDSSIRIEARRVGDRGVLRVEDRGIGMSPDQYAELNERLATPPMVDVAVSRMMGLVVVARLAARHGVRVELLPSPERGTVADVLLPSGVLVPRSLAGRTHAPSGFPAIRQPDAPPARPNFGPPLALESGPGGGGGGWDDGRGGRPSAAPPGMPPTFGGMPAGTPPAPAPAFGSMAGPPSGYSTANSGYTGPTGPGGFAAAGPPAAGAAPGAAAGAAIGGLGAALAGAGMSGGNGGFGGPGGPAGGPANGGGRGVPAWYDLTGATPGQGGYGGYGQPPPPPPAGPGPGFGPTGEPLPQRRPWGEENDAPAIPRQSGERWDGPPPGLGGFGPGGPTPGFGSSAQASPPAAARPPAWPPVAEDVPGLPQGLSSSLDMTSETPRMRGLETPAPPSQLANDMTMELPIFRELESAWFAGGPAPEAAAAVRPGGWSPEGAGASAMAGSRASGGWSERSEGAANTGDQVSWRTHADDGWRAAEAAMQPQDGGTTDMGLPRRVPMAQLVPGGVDTQAGVSDRRTPDSVRGLLSAYTRGVQRGRGAGNDTSGREQEA